MSISSDVPSFFYGEGVTLDFLMVALAWQLDLKDLKKLALNGITYSSVSEQVKADLKVAFEQEWDKFIIWAVKEASPSSSSSQAEEETSSGDE